MSEEKGIYRTGAAGLFASLAREVVVANNYDLKPCPFCGSKNVHIETMSGAIILNPGDMYYVLCECMASGPTMSVEINAVTAWNKRVGEP